MPNQPSNPAKNVTGDSATFVNFMRRLVAVPHSEIKAKLDAERTSKACVSRASGAAPKRAS